MYKPIKRPVVLESPTPRAPLPKDSEEWATRTVSRLRWALDHMAISKCEADKVIAELREHKGWERILDKDGKPYESLDRLLLGEFGISAESWAALTYIDIS